MSLARCVGGLIRAEVPFAFFGRDDGWVVARTFFAVGWAGWRWGWWGWCLGTVVPPGHGISDGYMLRLQREKQRSAIVGERRFVQMR